MRAAAHNHHSCHKGLNVPQLLHDLGAEVRPLDCLLHLLFMSHARDVAAGNARFADDGGRWWFRDRYRFDLGGGGFGVCFSASR